MKICCVFPVPDNSPVWCAHMYRHTIVATSRGLPLHNEAAGLVATYSPEADGPYLHHWIIPPPSARGDASPSIL